MIKIKANIEDTINTFLQQEITITNRNKVIKEGRLILFSVKDFHLNFKFQTDLNKFSILEVPYPFNYFLDKGSLLLSYKPELFVNGDSTIEHLMKFYFFKRPSKFFDSEIKIYIKSL